MNDVALARDPRATSSSAMELMTPHAELEPFKANIAQYLWDCFWLIQDDMVSVQVGENVVVQVRVSALKALMTRIAGPDSPRGASAA